VAEARHGQRRVGARELWTRGRRALNWLAGRCAAHPRRRAAVVVDEARQRRARARAHDARAHDARARRHRAAVRLAERELVGNGHARRAKGTFGGRTVRRRAVPCAAVRRAIEKVLVRTRRVAEAARARALVLIGRVLVRARAARAHGHHARIGEHVGARARHVHVCAAISDVVAVRRRAVVAARAIDVRLAAVCRVRDEATRADGRVLVVGDARDARARAAGVVAVRPRAVRLAARVICRVEANTRGCVARVDGARIRVGAVLERKGRARAGDARRHVAFRVGMRRALRVQRALRRRRGRWLGGNERNEERDDEHRCERRCRVRL